MSVKADEGKERSLPLAFSEGGAMNVAAIFRYTVLVVSGMAMILGVLVMVGVLIPRYFPENYAIIMGAVIFLYGAYRFVITYYRPRQRREE